MNALKKQILFAITLAVGATQTFAATFNESIDLSSGVLELTRMSNGYLSGATSNSITLNGSDGNFYYPNTDSVVSFSSQLSGISNFLLNNPLSTDITYLGDLPASSGSIVINYGDPGSFQLASFDSHFSEHLASYSYTYSAQFYEIRLSYDYTYSSSDTPGWDIAHGPNLNISAPKSGHIDYTLGYANDQLGIQYFISSPADIAWGVLSKDNVGGRGILTISNASIGISEAVTKTVALAVPEPETYAMFLSGLSILGIFVRRKKSD